MQAKVCKLMRSECKHRSFTIKHHYHALIAFVALHSFVLELFKLDSCLFLLFSIFKYSSSYFANARSMVIVVVAEMWRVVSLNVDSQVDGVAERVVEALSSALAVLRTFRGGGTFVFACLHASKQAILNSNNLTT